MSRTLGEDACWQQLEAILARRDRLTALDLGGDKLGYTGHEFLSHFVRARDAGPAYHRACRRGGAAPESIWQAIAALDAERIADRVKAIEDPKLMDFLADHAIRIRYPLRTSVDQK